MWRVALIWRLNMQSTKCLKELNIRTKECYDLGKRWPRTAPRPQPNTSRRGRKKKESKKKKVIKICSNLSSQKTACFEKEVTWINDKFSSSNKRNCWGKKKHAVFQGNAVAFVLQCDSLL